MLKALYVYYSLHPGKPGIAPTRSQHAAHGEATQGCTVLLCKSASSPEAVCRFQDHTEPNCHTASNAAALMVVAQAAGTSNTAVLKHVAQQVPLVGLAAGI